MAWQCQPFPFKEELTALLRKQHYFSCMKILQFSTSVCVGRRNDTETLGMQRGERGVLPSWPWEQGGGARQGRMCPGLSNEISPPPP